MLHRVKLVILFHLSIYKPQIISEIVNYTKNFLKKI